MLLKIPQILDADGVARARALLAAAPWSDGRSTAGRQAAQVKNNEQLSPGSEQHRELQALVLQALDRHPVFFSATLPKRVLPPLFNRYAGAANAYGNHVDQAVRYLPGGAQRVRTDISCTLFLSDPADYDGGDLVIDSTFGEQRVKLAAGDLVEPRRHAVGGAGDDAAKARADAVLEGGDHPPSMQTCATAGNSGPRP